MNKPPASSRRASAADVFAICISECVDSCMLAPPEQETINSQAQLELTQAQQQVADEQAQVDLAKEIALAELYAANPDYVTLQIALANAQAIKETDKLIFTPDGVFPNLIFSNNTIPTFNVTNP